MMALTIHDLPKPGEYVAWVRSVRAAFDAGHATVATRSWPPRSDTRATFDADVRAALHDRITLRGDFRVAGRKWDSRWQLDMARDARAMNAWRSQRIRPHLNTPEMRRRYAALIAGLQADR